MQSHGATSIPSVLYTQKRIGPHQFCIDASANMTFEGLMAVQKPPDWRGSRYPLTCSPSHRRDSLRYSRHIGVQDLSLHETVIFRASNNFHPFFLIRRKNCLFRESRARKTNFRRRLELNWSKTNFRCPRNHRLWCRPRPPKPASTWAAWSPKHQPPFISIGRSTVSIVLTKWSWPCPPNPSLSFLSSPSPA
jgi:hypothetical protein